MGCFVSDNIAAFHPCRQVCIPIQKHRRCPIIHGSRMLHPTILEIGNSNNIIYIKRVAYPRVVFHPIQCMTYLSSYDRDTGINLRSIRLPVVNTDPTPPHVTFQVREPPHGKSKQISTQWLCFLKFIQLIVIKIFRTNRFPVSHSPPPGRYFQRQFKSRLYIRLVKTRHQCTTPVRNQQRV